MAHQLVRWLRVPIRKKGKLPHTAVRMAYSLEYVMDDMEMHVGIPCNPAKRLFWWTT